jgi:type IV pilus assembly protein PilA
MQKRRDGFTLIELLIVIVIIGILAAIAIPKFSATREKAYFKAMMSDLRNISAQQEIYYSDPENNYTYAPASTADSIGLRTFRRCSVTLVPGTQTGWSASAIHTAITDGRVCAIFFGDAAPVPPARCRRRRGVRQEKVRSPTRQGAAADDGRRLPATPLRPEHHS